LTRSWKTEEAITDQPNVEILDQCIEYKP